MFNINAPKLSGHAFVEVHEGDCLVDSAEKHNDFLISFVEYLKTNSSVTSTGVMRVGNGSAPTTPTTRSLSGHIESFWNPATTKNTNVTTFDTNTRTYTCVAVRTMVFPATENDRTVRELGMIFKSYPLSDSPDVHTRVVLDADVLVAAGQQLTITYTITATLVIAPASSIIPVTINGVTTNQTVAVTQGNVANLELRDFLANSLLGTTPQIANYEYSGVGGGSLNTTSPGTSEYSTDGDIITYVTRFAAGKTPASGNKIRTIQLGARGLLYYLFNPGIPMTTTDTLEITVTQNLAGLTAYN